MKDWCDLWQWARFDGDGGGDGAGSGGSVGGIGAEADAAGTGFGGDAASGAGSGGFGGTGQSANSAGVMGVPGGLGPSSSTSAVGGQVGDPGDAPGDTSFGGIAATEGVLAASMNSLNQAVNPATITGQNLGPLAAFSPVNTDIAIGAVQALGAVAESLGAPPGPDGPAGPSGDVGGPGPTSPEGPGFPAQDTASPPVIASAPLAPALPRSEPDPTQVPGIATPDLEPLPEPEPISTDSEEAERLRRARAYFGLSGTNVTGPLGLQAPAPVYRPSARPVLTAKRKLGA